MSNKTESTINGLEYGRKLMDSIGAVFSGAKPAKADEASKATALLSDAVAINVSKQSDDPLSQMLLLTSNRKDYLKFSSQKLTPLEPGLATYFLTGIGLVLKDSDGKPARLKYESEVFEGSLKAESSISDTTKSLLEILGTVPDREILVDIAKAQKSGRAAVDRLLAELNAKDYGHGSHISGGNDQIESTLWYGSLSWDTDGVMKGILTLSTKTALYMDMGEKGLKDAGECYAVLIGDAPFRKDKGLYIKVPTEVADALVLGRCYYRIGEACARRRAVIKKDFEQSKIDGAAKAKALQSEVLKNSVANLAAIKGEVAPAAQ